MDASHEYLRRRSDARSALRVHDAHRPARLVIFILLTLLLIVALIAPGARGGLGVIVMAQATPTPNRPPVAVADAYSVLEDQVLYVDPPGVTLNDSDPDGDRMTAHFRYGPSHGWVNFNLTGEFDYTPSRNFNGTDSFTYTVLAPFGGARP